MSNWYSSSDGITHYCRGCETTNQQANKPKATHTEGSYWFHPVKVEDQKLTCNACQATIQLGDEHLIVMGD